MDPIWHTRWPSLKDTTHPQRLVTPWRDFVTSLNPIVTLDKHSSPGFGPYTLKPQAVARLDASVLRMTMLVYDADEGTHEDMAACMDLVKSEGLCSLLYSSYSYSATKAAYRLIFPLARHTHPDEFKPIRLAVGEHFRVPYNPQKCAGLSHFYFVPSHPPGAAYVFVETAGQFLDPSRYLKAAGPTRHRLPHVALKDFEPPPEPEIPESLDVYRIRLAARTTYGDEKAELVRKLLDGEPLAEHGGRTLATLRVAGMLAHMFRKASVGTLLRLMDPSLTAMRARGSKLTTSRVRRMILTSMRHRAEAEATLSNHVDTMNSKLEAYRQECIRKANSND